MDDFNATADRKDLLIHYFILDGDRPIFYHAFPTVNACPLLFRHGVVLLQPGGKFDGHGSSVNVRGFVRVRYHTKDGRTFLKVSHAADMVPILVRDNKMR
jgi:hypothetical protein